STSLNYCKHDKYKLLLLTLIVNDVIYAVNINKKHDLTFFLSYLNTSIFLHPLSTFSQTVDFLHNLSRKKANSYYSSKFTDDKNRHSSSPSLPSK
ncbi:MAG: hypothetical protein ACEY3M_02425, partial [Wolbachia sp.]